MEQRLAVEHDVSARRALILALAAASPDRLPQMSSQMAELYELDIDPGIHGAAGYFLRKWGLEDRLLEIDQKLATGEIVGDRNWYLAKKGLTFTIIDGPETLMVRRDHSAPPDKHRFAIAATETTVEQFRAFMPGHKIDEKVAGAPGSPVNMVSWHLAAAYCNWLTLEEGMGDECKCYLQVSRDPDLYELLPDYQARAGYRLPTMAEWQYACVAGAKTGWSFGVANADLASRYMWWLGNSRKGEILSLHAAASLKPNDFGLFDMHGNVAEWCQDSDQPGTRLGKDDLWGVLHGGHFRTDYPGTGSAEKFPYGRKNFDKSTGFRVARTPPIIGRAQR